MKTRHPAATPRTPGRLGHRMKGAAHQPDDRAGPTDLLPTLSLRKQGDDRGSRGGIADPAPDVPVVGLSTLSVRVVHAPILLQRGASKRFVVRVIRLNITRQLAVFQSCDALLIGVGRESGLVEVVSVILEDRSDLPEKGAASCDLRRHRVLEEPG